MENGGSLYIESVNLGQDHSNTDFFDYLGISYLNYGGNQEAFQLSGVEGEMFSENMSYLSTGGYSPHFSIDRLGSNGADLMFQSEDSMGRMFHFETDTYKAISSSVILATFVSGDTLSIRPYLAAEIVNNFLDFDPNVAVEENETRLSNRVYPNPFVGETRIDYSIEKSGVVKIDIYNINGQVVKNLLSETKSVGKYSISWDATDNNGAKLESGLYFYTLTSHQNTFTEKILLIK